MAFIGIRNHDEGKEKKKKIEKQEGAGWRCVSYFMKFFIRKIKRKKREKEEERQREIVS